MLERIRVMGVAGAIAAVAVLAGCGSGGSSSTQPTAAGGGGAAAGGGATVSVSDNAELGKILVDSRGMTLYLFEKDDAADESYCSGACAKEWPPLTTNGAPQAGPGVSGKLTTFKRDDGTTQVAYDGHPLYYFAQDASPGDVNGNGSTAFGAEWYAITPDGKPAEGSEGGEEGSSTTTSGGGYSY